MCVQDEFIFQHYIQYKRPNNELSATYLKGDGPTTFNWVSIPGDLILEYLIVYVTHNACL